MNLGGKYYEKEVLDDLMVEPKEICSIEKRKSCDSLYINLNRKLLKDNRRLIETNEHLNTKLILISDLLYCTQLSEELKLKILEIIENEEIK